MRRSSIALVAALMSSGCSAPSEPSDPAAPGGAAAWPAAGGGEIAVRDRRAEFVPADKAILKGGVEIGISTVKIGKVNKDLMGMISAASEDGLIVVIEIANNTAGKRIPYKLWDESMATLVDDEGNTYRYTLGPSDFPVGRTVERQGSIDPGKAVAEVLVFEVPVEQADHLDLTLTGADIEGLSTVRFRIPSSMYTEKVPRRN